MPASQRRLKKAIVALLAGEDVDHILTTLSGYPPETLLNALFSGICHADERIHWNAVVGMGVTVARLAEQEMEAARIVMRRFMWSLNDESGGIGWGAPEAMAECLARHEGLALEYTHILVSFMREDGFYLELPALQRGLMWGMARMAGSRPDLLRKWQAPRYLLPYLDSEDPTVRGLAGLSLALLDQTGTAGPLVRLLDDHAQLPFFHQGAITTVTVADLLQRALSPQVDHPAP
ncbi:MAG: DVU0298 family protein [Thermodesulfobacteriota bacterium]